MSCANTDEMEPGTFKDRVLVNTDPHLVIEGIILAGYAMRAEKGYFFIRPTYETGRPAHGTGSWKWPGRPAFWGRISWGAIFPST